MIIKINKDFHQKRMWDCYFIDTNSNYFEFSNDKFKNMDFI